MGTRSLEIVCFRRRYYIRYRQYDGYFECAGAGIVASIPANPDKYQITLLKSHLRLAMS